MQLRSQGNREHVIVDRGKNDGVQVGDLAVFRDPRRRTFCLAGEVDGLSERFARIRTLGDAEAWWLARAPSGRFILEPRTGERGFRIVDPEHRRALQDSARKKEIQPRIVVTAADQSRGREVPEGLGIGVLRPGSEAEGESFWVEPFYHPHRELGVRLERGQVVRRFAPRTSSGSASWWPARVRQVWDANPLRASLLVSCVGRAYPVPVDAPVARGEFLEGWVHTAAGSDARVRLVEDPGFYTQVLVLRCEEGDWMSPGGGVFRGRRREGSILHGRVERARGLTLQPGDLLVVGPHKGGGGIGLTVGEVVSSEAGGSVTLRRWPRPRRGDGLWIGRFPRPSAELLAVPEDTRLEDSR